MRSMRWSTDMLRPHWDSAYAQLQWACSIIGAILVTINPAYKVHELVSRLIIVQVLILNLGITGENAEPRQRFPLVFGSERPNLEIPQLVGRGVS
jgi:hypothetical protein